jgi:hypothetical protein
MEMADAMPNPPSLEGPTLQLLTAQHPDNIKAIEYLHNQLTKNPPVPHSMVSFIMVCESLACVTTTNYMDDRDL